MIFFHLLLFLFLVFLFFINVDKSEIRSEVKCLGKKYNRTCLYKNVYYFKGKWYVYGIKKKKIKCVAIRIRSSSKCFKPSITQYNIKYGKTINGITTYVNLFSTKNIGHLLFDDLYSVYLSLIKFNFHMNPFNIILSKENSNWKNNWQTRVYEQFSMNKIIYEEDISRNVFLIKYLIIGIAHQCQRCINKDYSIAGGKEYNATWWMRKRMYYAYSINQCSYKYAIIVDNKRYSLYEKKIFNKIIHNYTSRMKILYINWRCYSDFIYQLKILSCTSIYISGPGTGLLYFPFISDPGVIINLGGIYRGCPSFMEQYIEEGSPHFVALYYPSYRRIFGIQETVLKILLEKAMNIIYNWNKYKSKHESNLSIEGRLFKKLFDLNPVLMNKLLADTDWAKEDGHGIWAERLIYFPFCYNLTYIVNLVFNVTFMYIKELGCESSKSRKLCD